MDLRIKRVPLARADRRIKCSPFVKLGSPPKGIHFDKKTGKVFLLFGNSGVTITLVGAAGCRYARGSIECCVFMSKRTGICALGHNRFVMDPLQQFCLKWNSFSNNLVTTFDNLFRSASLTDVTLFCEGVTFQAHKLILAACSKHFHDLFDSAPMSPNIVVILDGTTASNMAALLEFMYKGEVHVAQERLPSFLKAAEYLQVKGLSEKHDKLDSHHNTPSADMRGESPTNNRCANPKQIKSLSLSMGTRLEDGGSAGGGRADLAIDSMLPPSSPASNSFPSPYQLTFKTQPAYERSGPYEYRSKRHPRSPSDSQLRASVLRDGSKPERESPLSMGYSPSSVSHHYESLQQTLPSVLTISDGSVGGAGSYERSIKTEKSPSPQNWQHNSNCAEDLRMKSESVENTSTIDENGSDRRYGSGGGLDSSQRERDNSDRNPPPQPAPLEGGVPSSPSGSATTPTWTPGMASVKLDQPQKGIPSTTTDGKKLQCPFCERLYGYETNLRAHIRQRHQGIRVPCPFCTRTFTRNNTVRRHIAREHKTELNLKAIQQGQVQNHNQ